MARLASRIVWRLCSLILFIDNVMRVVTLTPALLADACRQLSARILAAGCSPALVVGIQSGGAEVARLMRADFPGVPYCEVRLSRPSTRQKEAGFVQRLLRRLPLWLCDLLRIVESRIGEWRSRGQLPARVGDLAIDADVPSDGTILLVDDAIDTGATIHTLRQHLAERFPGVTIRVAVITVTTARPVCDADFYLYHDRTLCRFPWSNDYRGKKVKR